MNKNITKDEMIVTLKEAAKEEWSEFTEKLQEAFAVAVEEKYGPLNGEKIPSDAEMEAALNAPKTVVYHIMSGDKKVGGTVLSIDEISQHNSLDLFFIYKGQHGMGLGTSAWKAIEEKYPETRIWETATPYFEKRNIHFYVNKLGFKIVEFFNENHKDPNEAVPLNEQGEPLPGGEEFFRFEKVMK